MSRRRARRLLREVAWLAVAVVMAFLLAGEVVRRSAFGEWAPWPRSNATSTACYIDLGNGDVVLVEILDGVGATRVFQAGPRRPKADRMLDNPVRPLNSGLFEMVLKRDEKIEEYRRIGWPLRYAEYTTSGRPLWASTPMSYPADTRGEWRVTHGLIRAGAVSIATRPVLPGFLVLVAACEAALMVARGGAWLLRGGLRRSRLRTGLCGRCGYDLAGLSGGVCPECGEGGSGEQMTQS